jgi:integrase
MAKVRAKNGNLFIDFYYNKTRYRVSLGVSDTERNMNTANVKLKLLESAIDAEKLGLSKVDLHAIFPESEQFAPKLEQPKAVLTFDEMYLAWLDNKVHLAKNTQRTWRAFHRKHVSPAIGYKKVNEINQTDIRMMIEAMKKDNKNSVINKKLVPLKTFFRELVEDEVITKNPLARVKPLRNDKPEIHPFTKEELRDLFNAFRDFYPHYTNFISFLAYSGCRPNEAVALQWKHIDWDNKVILIREGYVLGETTELKTTSSRRDIDMNSLLYNLLQDQFKKRVETAEQYVFVNMYGKRICWENFRQKYHKALDDAGLKPRPAYQLRHTFASLALKAGEDPTWVSKTLGHSSLRTTLEKYNRYIASTDKKDGSRFAGEFEDEQ